MSVALTAAEEDVLAKLRTLTHAREIDAVVAFGEPLIEGLVDGAGSRAYTGLVFDGYCRALLAARGHGADTRREIARLCERSRATFGDEPWTELYAGCLAHLAGSDEEAARAYRRAARDVAVLWPSSVGCRSVIGPSRADGYTNAPGTLPAMTFEMLARIAPRVIFAACDHAYLHRFAASYVRSFAAFGNGCALHVHVVNPEPGDAAWIEAQASGLRDRVGITSETYDGPDARAYFASARLLRLVEISERYDAAVLATDIDAVLTAPIDPQLLDSRRADVRLNVKAVNYRVHPWNAIAAGAIAVAPTSGGRAFASALRAMAAGSFADRAGDGIWFVDQNVIFAAKRQAERDGSARVGDLSGELPGFLRFGKTL